MKFTATIFAAVALISNVYAQTYSECNVLEGKTCPPNKALGKSFTYDYTKEKKECKEFTATGSKDKILYNDEGMVMRVNAELDSPTLASNWYIMWGRVDVVCKAAPGKGVISSIVFQSDVLDEIDWEWIGSKGEEIQSNYFGKGNTTTYDRGGVHADPGATSTFKKYSVDWTKERIQWLINDEVIRTLTYPEANGGHNYPQTPCQIKLGSWDAGHPKQKEGTLEWAGGYTDYSQTHDMVVQSITVTDYTEGAKAYSYGDNTGSFESIKVDTTGETLKDDDKKDDGKKDNEEDDSSSTSTTDDSEEIDTSSNTTSSDDTKATEGSLLDDAESETTPAASTPTAQDSGASKVVGSMAVSFFAAAIVFAL